MASSATLATLRDRVELTLRDSGNTNWSTDEIDEAITVALDRYSHASPHRAVTTKTLTEDGRQIDVSSISYLTIYRVWWDYDSTDPEHPPNWRAFEVWPGDLLYINDPDEPQSGDVVRIWYTAPHTLKDLAAAEATTFPPDADSLLVTGAAGLAAHSRALEIGETLGVDGWTYKRMRVWAEHKLDEFNQGLARVARQEAARHTGSASPPTLDRWDRTDDPTGRLNSGWC